jgi:hypothetical protein
VKAESEAEGDGLWNLGGGESAPDAEWVELEVPAEEADEIEAERYLLLRGVLSSIFAGGLSV